MSRKSAVNELTRVLMLVVDIGRVVTVAVDIGVVVVVVVDDCAGSHILNTQNVGSVIFGDSGPMMNGEFY